MKVKVFHIRHPREYLQPDQDKINEFIEKVNVKKTALELISGQIKGCLKICSINAKTRKRKNNLSIISSGEII